MMSSLFVQWLNLSIPNALRLLGILILALLGNRLLRALTNLLIHPVITGKGKRCFLGPMSPNVRSGGG